MWSLLYFSLLGAHVFAGFPDGYLSLLNATPYNWNLTSSSSQGMTAAFGFPSIIPAGGLTNNLARLAPDYTRIF